MTVERSMWRSEIRFVIRNDVQQFAVPEPRVQVSGHEVWNMTAKGPSVEITQSMLRNNGTLYKMMAVTVGGNPDADAVNRFIASLSIVQASSATTETSKQQDVQPIRDLGGDADLHSLSKTIGGAGALLGVGLLVYFLTRGKKNRQT